MPANLRVNDSALAAAEINFLCVHKKLRAKRLTPLLIKEVTRRVNLTGVWHAAFTAGVVIPKPAATCRYYHRSLNPKKLIEVGFSSLGPRSTMVRTIKLHRLPEQPLTPGAYSVCARSGRLPPSSVPACLSSQQSQQPPPSGLGSIKYSQNRVIATIKCRTTTNTRRRLPGRDRRHQRVPRPVQAAAAL